jgi:hypothetical protein
MHRIAWPSPCALVVCLLALSAPQAQAQLAMDYVTDNNNGTYLVLPNGTVTVDLYLRESLANANTVSLLANEGSIYREGVQATRTTSPTSPAVITAAHSDPFFVSMSDAVQPGGAQATLSAANAPGTPAPLITDSSFVRRVRLGQMTFQAGLIPLQTTTFTLADIPGQNDTITNGAPGVILDGLIGSRTFSIATTPEPTTAAVLAVALATALPGRRRRRRTRGQLRRC